MYNCVVLLVPFSIGATVFRLLRRHALILANIFLFRKKKENSRDSSFFFVFIFYWLWIKKIIFCFKEFSNRGNNFCCDEGKMERTLWMIIKIVLYLLILVLINIYKRFFYIFLKKLFLFTRISNTLRNFSLLKLLSLCEISTSIESISFVDEKKHHWWKALISKGSIKHSLILKNTLYNNKIQFKKPIKKTKHKT